METSGPDFTGDFQGLQSIDRRQGEGHRTILAG